MRPSAPDLPNRALAGAQVILRECLRLEPGQTLGIVHDERSAGVVRILGEAAEAMGLLTKRHSVALKEQRKFRPGDPLPGPLQELLRSSLGILTCLAADPKATPFRIAVVKRALGFSRRVGHMPGVDERVLGHAVGVDFAKVAQRCDDLSLALTVGDRVRLRTYADPSRPETSEHFDLRLRLGERRGVVSSGVIPSGTWGNLPGGETFIAPLEGTASGRFALNGAFHGCVLRPGELLVLEFRRGRLQAVEASSTALQARFEKLFRHVNGKNGETWRVLGELGVGANEGIRKLLGNSLFDEKCLGTVHVALGDNRSFGGSSHSEVHEDLVTRSPSLWVGGKVILRNGEFAFRAKDWREDIRTYAPAAVLSEPSLRVGHGIVKARVREGRLTVECDVFDNRLNTYTVGNPETSVLLAAIFSAIPHNGTVALPELAERLDGAAHQISEDQLRRGLSILLAHQLVSAAKP